MVKQNLMNSTEEIVTHFGHVF